MPPKVKITKEGVIHTALDIVRESGAEALNARAVAAKLGCSTQPVFSNFSNMEELLSAVIGAAYELYLGFLKNEAEKEEFERLAREKERERKELLKGKRRPDGGIEIDMSKFRNN